MSTASATVKAFEPKLISEFLFFLRQIQIDPIILDYRYTLDIHAHRLYGAIHLGSAHYDDTANTRPTAGATGKALGPKLISESYHYWFLN